MNTDERDDLDRDRDLDARLRAAFVPPPATVSAAAARTAVEGTAPRERPRVWPWLVVLAAALAVVALFLQRPRRGTEGHGGGELGAMWVAAYEHALDEGFAGASCCTPDVDLAKLCEEKFATRLGVAAGSVRLLGCYCGKEPVGGCMALLARSGGEPVAVYVLPCRDDPRPRLPEGSPLHLARREVGPLVLYALSRSAAAATLEDFVVP
ncbi:MAG: hypothetical protein JNK78_01785 [Planctomycetes bacterium]|nr:hypothetical protein [Planctomycetota bacterium]